MNQLNSRQFPDVYKKLNVNITDLGCIMLDLPSFKVTPFVLGGEDDLFYGKIPELKYAQGAVSETKAHVTLLFGLMESGKKWQDEVDAVLDGWKIESVTIGEISSFPSNIPGQDYDCIVGKIVVTPELLEGHQRLQLLPHIDTFPDYTPHVTLAYIKRDEEGVKLGESTKEKWLRSLQPLEGVNLPISGLNYGGE